MPIKKIPAKSQVQFLSILDESGEVDEELEPKLPGDQMVKGFRTMLLARRFDERMLKLQRSGQIGTFAPVKGQEAAQLGAISAITDNDWFVPSYRETCASLWRGTPLTGILLYNAGYNEGGLIPDDHRDMPIAVPVGTQMLHAVGIAYGMRYREENSVVMTFFGDGATSQGDFHEAMNFAGVFGLPVVFVCENNQYAISMPREHQTASKTLAQKALAYGMRGIQVDGNDVLAVHVAAAEAVKRAREDREPTLIECLTYRMEVHTTADDPTRYRDDEEVEKWRQRDPIDRFRKYLQTRDVLSDDDVEAMEEEIANEIDQAWSKTQDRIGELEDDPLHMFEHLLAERPAYLDEQRERYAAALDNGEARGGADG